jgi:hypothetical protein
MRLERRNTGSAFGTREERETLLHLVHRQILENNEMNAISLRVHLAELHDVGGLDTPKNDIRAAVSEDLIDGLQANIDS